MKLHEIITINEEPHKTVLYELCQPYLKSLKKYYQNYFDSRDIIVMVSNVTNSTCYVKFCCPENFEQSVLDYLCVNYVETDRENENFNEDLFCQYETINFNSFYL